MKKRALPIVIFVISLQQSSQSFAVLDLLDQLFHKILNLSSRSISCSNCLKHRLQIPYFCSLHKGLNTVHKFRSLRTFQQCHELSKSNQKCHLSVMTRQVLRSRIMRALPLIKESLLLAQFLQ
uniref:Secreted RxLR effector protein 80 n=1 Tax=Plasmopara viticola TaxID=143451 RepID=RLR80_PLAVT|nr:RecName: Full=Secreted RxLR effector protein 80; Flags: Precursor [Plasmopara viticola]